MGSVHFVEFFLTSQGYETKSRHVTKLVAEPPPFALFSRMCRATQVNNQDKAHLPLLHRHPRTPTHDRGHCSWAKNVASAAPPALPKHQSNGDTSISPAKTSANQETRTPPPQPPSTPQPLILTKTKRTSYRILAEGNPSNQPNDP